MKGLLRIVVVVAALAVVPLIFTSNTVLNFLIVALMIALAGQGWNVLGGYGGQYSFGHAAFFGTGAYATAILQARYGVNAWFAFALGIAAGALIGAVIGFLTFRSGLQGSYFALVTLAFAEVLRIIASVAPITGAGVGTLIKLDLRPEALQFQSRAAFYWLLLALVAVSLLIVQAIAQSRFGAWLVAVRENEEAAPALGVDTYRGEACRHDGLGRHHGGGRLLLRAVLPVRRCRHRLWPVDLGRGAAHADHRRGRHRVRAAAWRAGGEIPGRARQARGRRRPRPRSRHLRRVLILVVGFAPRGIAGALADGRAWIVNRLRPRQPLAGQAQ